MRDLSDEQLLVLYGEKDDYEAFREFYRRYASRIFSYALKKLGSKEVAEDLLQTIFSKIHRLRSRYNPKYLASQWVFVISRSEIKDFLKKEATRSDYFAKYGDHVRTLSQIEDETPIPGDDPLSGVSSGQVLTEDERELVEMRVLDELSYKEIAQVLGRSEVSLRQALRRALKKLRGMKS